MKIIKRIELSVAIALVLSVIISVASFAVTCQGVRNNVLRLHVLAASDSNEDQNLKLKVRDAVLAQGADIFDGSVNIENATRKIAPRLDELENTARNVIRENGYDYDVSVTLKKDFFTTRTYDKVTLPAGKYLAVRVIIDKGEGHNWWCVMFPTLCIPVAGAGTGVEDVLNEDETRLVYENPRYEPRFKIIEIIEKWKNHEK